MQPLTTTSNRKKTLQEKQLEMRERHEPRSRTIARTMHKLVRVVRYLENYPGQAHADAMRIVEDAWRRVYSAGLEEWRREYEAERAERTRYQFKKRGA